MYIHIYAASCVSSWPSGLTFVFFSFHRFCTAYCRAKSLTCRAAHIAPIPKRLLLFILSSLNPRTRVRAHMFCIGATARRPVFRVRVKRQRTYIVLCVRARCVAGEIPWGSDGWKRVRRNREGGSNEIIMPIQRCMYIYYYDYYYCCCCTRPTLCRPLVRAQNRLKGAARTRVAAHNAGRSNGLAEETHIYRRTSQLVGGGGGIGIRLGCGKRTSLKRTFSYDFSAVTFRSIRSYFVLFPRHRRTKP